MHHGHIFEAEFLHSGGDQFHPGPVQGGVDDLHLFVLPDGFRGEGQPGYFLQVYFIDLRTDHMDVFRFAAEFHFRYRRDLLHFGNDVFIVRRDKLTAVVPVCFVPVVFRGVVRGGNDDAALAAEMPHGKG